MTFLLQGCGEHYADLETLYANETADVSEGISGSTITLTSTNRSGAFTLREVATVAVKEKSVAISIEFPFGALHKPIEIPASSVSGCGKACFSKDNWETELYLTETGTALGLENSNVLIDWCWKNRIPIIPGDIERAWKYKGKSLPPKEEYASQFESIEHYIYLAKQSCLGY